MRAERYSADEPVGARAVRVGEAEASRPRVTLGQAILGIVGLFGILGLVLGILGFAAAFGLDRAADAARAGAAAEDAAAGIAGVPAVLVSLLPFLAAPVLALGCGAWAGHATRSAREGSVAGALGGLVGPILTLLLAGLGFALGVGTSGVDLDAANVPGLGFTPGWTTTLPYVFTGAGLLWLVCNAISGGLSGGLVGGLMDRWLDRRAEGRSERRVARRPGAPRV